MADCIFCNLAQKKIPADILYEDDQVIAFNDIQPQAPTHVLVITKEHIATLNDLTDQHFELMGHMIQVAQRLAKTLGIAQKGYRLVMNCNQDGGQAVYHIHLHILGGRSMHWPPG